MFREVIGNKSRSDTNGFKPIEKIGTSEKSSKEDAKSA